MPAVSVIIPVYNTEPYLADCLSSVLGQSFSDFEVIAVDDGSTDDSSSILRDFASKDSRIRIVSQENRGLSGARGREMGAKMKIFARFSLSFVFTFCRKNVRIILLRGGVRAAKEAYQIL